MRSQIQVKPQVNRLIQFLSLIEEGKFKIPTFQRDFVWQKKNKIELFDSISKEYPIGSILLWQPKERFDNKAEIGPYFINHSENSDFFYILDGFQRLSTLFGCLTNPNKTMLECDYLKLKKDFSVYYDLEDDSFNMNQNGTITNVPVYVLIDTYEFLDYCDKLRVAINDIERAKILIEKAKKLSSTIIDYQIPSIEIFGGSINDAVDIFSRVNSKGITISQDWMLSALTSNEEEKFNLGELLGILIEDLKEFNFHDIKRDVLVQCIQASFGKLHYDQKIEDLAKRNDFKVTTIQTIESIKSAIRFLFEHLMVFDRKLLPYNNQLVFLTVFFNDNKGVLSRQQIEKLKNWFWITSYSNYFTIYSSLSKNRLALEQFKKFVANENEDPVYYGNYNQRFSIAELPSSVSSKSVRSNSYILFLLNHIKNFEKVEANNIDSCKISYLFWVYTNHSNVFPIIRYINGNDILPFSFDKHKDMSYLLSHENFRDYSKQYFLTEEMVDIYRSNHVEKFERILALRFNLIENAERKFVESLNISYNE